MKIKKLFGCILALCFVFAGVNIFADVNNNKEVNIEELAKQLGNHSLLVYQKGQISFQDEHGIQPLLIQIEKKGLKKAIVVDKVIGKAAALLMVYGKVNRVHTDIIAKDAITVFEKHKIKFSYNKKVDYILNVKKDGLCPMEQKVKDTDSPKKAYKIFAK